MSILQNTEGKQEFSEKFMKVVEYDPFTRMVKPWEDVEELPKNKKYMNHENVTQVVEESETMEEECGESQETDVALFSRDLAEDIAMKRKTSKIDVLGALIVHTIAIYQKNRDSYYGFNAKGFMTDEQGRKIRAVTLSTEDIRQKFPWVRSKSTISRAVKRLQEALRADFKATIVNGKYSFRLSDKLINKYSLLKKEGLLAISKEYAYLGELEGMLVANLMYQLRSPLCREEVDCEFYGNLSGYRLSKEREYMGVFESPLPYSKRGIDKAILKLVQKGVLIACEKYSGYYRLADKEMMQKPCKNIQSKIAKIDREQTQRNHGEQTQRCGEQTQRCGEQTQRNGEQTQRFTLTILNTLNSTLNSTLKKIPLRELSAPSASKDTLAATLQDKQKLNETCIASTKQDRKKEARERSYKQYTDKIVLSARLASHELLIQKLGNAGVRKLFRDHSKD